MPILLRLGMVIGVAMAGAVAYRWLRGGVPVPLEMGLLCAFLLWAVGSGLFLFQDARSFQQGIKRMVQVLFVACCCSSMAAASRTPAIGFLATTGLALVLVVYGLMTGDFAAAAELTQKGDRVVAHRATSLMANANGLGVSCVWALAGLTILWRKTTRLWQQGFLISLTLPLLAGVVYSGSRKAVLLVPFFLVAWVWFCYRHQFLRRAAAFVAVGVASAVCVLGATFIMRNTYTGHRLRAALSAEDKDASTLGRISMIEKGLKMVLDHPFSGVGLSQFMVYTGHGYAHNDYVEVVATTGLVGFSVYYSIFGLAAWRLIRIRRGCQNPELNYVAGVCLAVLVTCAAAGLVLVMFSSVAFWCLIGGVIGFASAADRRVPQQARRFGGRPTRPIASWRPKPVPSLQSIRR